MNEPRMPETARENKRKYIYFVTEEVAEMISRDKKQLLEDGYPKDQVNYEIYKRYSSYCKDLPYLNPLEAPGMSEWDLASLMVDGLVEPSIYDAGGKAANREYASWSQCSDNLIRWLIPTIVISAPIIGLLCLFVWKFYGVGYLINGTAYLVFGIILLLLPFLIYFVAWLGGMLCSKKKVDSIEAEIETNEELSNEYKTKFETVKLACKRNGKFSTEAVSKFLGLPTPSEIFGTRIWAIWFTRFYWNYGSFFNTIEGLVLLSIYSEHHLDKLLSPIVSKCPFLKGYTSDYVHLKTLGIYPWIELPPFILAYNSTPNITEGEKDKISEKILDYLRDAEDARLSYVFKKEKHKRMRRFSHGLQDDLLRYYGQNESAMSGYLVVEINRTVFPTTHLYTKEDKYVVMAINVGLWNRAENPSLVKAWEYDFTEEEYLNMPFDIGDVFVPTEFYHGKDAQYHGNNFKRYKVIHANYEDFYKFMTQKT